MNARSTTMQIAHGGVREMEKKRPRENDQFLRGSHAGTDRGVMSGRR
jgi:hypothetical protein